MRELAFLIAALTLASQARALDVIHDTGEAVPSAQYMGQLFTIDIGNPSAMPPGLELVTFPVRTTEMMPGVLHAEKSLRHASWLAQPVFLIGSDLRSREWLLANRERLQQLQAWGIVVEVDSYATFRALQQIAAEVPLAPASANGIGRALDLTVYPVLLQPNGEVTQ